MVEDVVMVREAVTVDVWLAVFVEVGAELPVVVGVQDPETVVLAVAVWVEEAVREEVRVDEEVRAAVPVGVEEGVAVAAAVWVKVEVAVSVWVEEGVAVLVLVDV